MADVNRGGRPLSPHLQIYRLPFNAYTSILNRITGNAMIVSAALVVWWLIALAAGPGPYAVANAVITSWAGDLVMVLSLLGLWYHMLAGIRHLIWDAGRMLEVGQAEWLGKLAVGGAVVLTALSVLIVRAWGV